jgi:DNA repair protein SbcC/Rad50
VKPIQLTLAGLQSYRDKQVVDFTKLSDAGVFGIFGPTGSGKSSILDAMTLALYGKVERAPGGTQGIINQMETVCSVSFTFELNGAAGSERYRVERQYKRTGDVSVNQSISRLICLDGGEAAVIADKAKDVDTRIQDILGLSMQDFTRAVVLPQGKFAEFLSLKGVERRHMLERLFHLEQYGDSLGGKVNAMSRETDMAVKRTEAEQLGLGDASAAALKEAGERLAAAEHALREQRGRLQAAERDTEEKRRLWKLVQEQTALVDAERKLAERLPEMDMIRNRLRLSGQAFRVEHFLKEWEMARSSLEETSSKLSAAEKEYESAAAACTAQEEAYRKAKERLEQEAEPLQSRLDSLKRSLELHKEIGVVEIEAGALAARETLVVRELEAAAVQSAKEQLLLDKAFTLQTELRARLSGLELPQGRREMLQSALMDLQKWDSARNQLNEASSEILDVEERMKPLKKEAGLYRLRKEEQARLHEEVKAQAAGLWLELGEALRTAERLHAAIQEGEAAELGHAQEAYIASLAANLAGSLLNGEPCPVCGSCEHPKPAQSGEAAQADHASNAERWKQLGHLLSGSRISAGQLQSLFQGELSRLETEPNTADGQPPGQPFLEAAAGLAVVTLIPENGMEAHGTQLLPYSEASELAGVLNKGIQSLQFSIKNWTLKLRGAADEERKLADKLAETAAKLEAMELALHAATAKRDSLKRQEQDLREKWPVRYPGLAAEMVQTEWLQLQEILRQQEEVRGRLDKSEPYLNAQRDKLVALKEEGFRLERDRIQVSTEKQGREALLQEKRSRLLEQLQVPLSEQETDKLYQTVTGNLQAIKAAEADGRRQLEQLQEERNRLSNTRAAAAQARKSAAASFERAWSIGERELAEAGFGSSEEARAALLTAVETESLEESVRLHQERLVEARGRLVQLTEALGGGAVTEEQWQASEGNLSVERIKDEECLQQKAKSERDLEDLEAKHGRWKELERLRQEAQTMLSRLQKLQSVLRGNAFVEFMAEEQLSQVSRAASERLGQLTRRRYALETDSTGGFIIRDDANGGLKRPVSTLSGGETFLTSLALALALSAQIQLNGKYPLEFFFLDEGFGTLDPELLETVVHALEKLHMEQLTVGVISHVPELKSRLPRRLVVTPSEPSGAGSQIAFEIL